jgi:hypothetical protein
MLKLLTKSKAGPGWTEQAVNFTDAMVRWTKARFPVVSPEQLESRKSICSNCDEWNPKARFGLGKCGQCGCTEFKAWLATEQCKLGKWHQDRLAIRCNCDLVSGFGQFSMQVIQELIRLGYDIQIMPADRDEGYVELPLEITQRIQKQGSADLHITEMSKPPGPGAVWWTMWETTVPPRVKEMNQCRMIIVPSQWNAKCFKAAGVTVPIMVVPLCIDTSIYKPQPFPDGLFTLLTGGDECHGGARKGFKLVMDAFQAAFPCDHVRLKVKLAPGRKWRCDDSRVDVDNRYLTDKEMVQWYASGHVYVSGSAAEGWGLMQHQSMACGRPLIAAKYSGMAEYFDASCGYPVSFKVGPSGGPYTGQGNWAHLNIISLEQAMESAYCDWKLGTCWGKPFQIRSRMAAYKASCFAIGSTTIRMVETLSEGGLIHSVPIRWKSASVARSQRHIPTFYHAGDLGDVLFGCLAIKHLGGGILFLGQKTDNPPDLRPRDGINQKSFDFLRPLLAVQPYLIDVQYTPIIPEVDYDLNQFRYWWHGEYQESLAEVYRRYGKQDQPYSLAWKHLISVGIKECDETEPWLSVPSAKMIEGKSVIIHRSPRTQNRTFPWPKIIDQYGSKLLFIGLKSEHEAFCSEFGIVDFYQVKDALEMARIIAGSKLYIANCSLPYTIAEGLKVNCIQETRWDGHPPDNIFDRPNVQYYLNENSTINLPNL